MFVSFQFKSHSLRIFLSLHPLFESRQLPILSVMEQQITTISFGCLCQQLNPTYFFAGGSFQAYDGLKACFLFAAVSERLAGL